MINVMMRLLILISRIDCLIIIHLPSASANVGSHVYLDILISYERMQESVKVGLQFNI
jgi:hypothetical protein